MPKDKQFLISCLHAIRKEKKFYLHAAILCDVEIDHHICIGSIYLSIYHHSYNTGPICLKLGRPAHMTTSRSPTMFVHDIQCWSFISTMFSVYNELKSLWMLQKYTVFGFLKKVFEEAHPPYCSYGRPHLANKCPRSLVANSVSTCTQLFPQ